MAPTDAPAADDSVISATLTLQDARPIVGILMEVGPRSIAIGFERPGTIEPQLGQRATFTLTGDLVSGDHQAEGNVTGWRDAGDLRICTLRYRDLEKYRKLLGTQVGRTFNRRHSFRVRPGLDEPMAAKLEMASGSVAGQATDVSSSGLGLIPERAVDVASGDVVTVHLTLPGDPRPAVVKVRVCHIGQAGDLPRYGLDFVVEDTPAFEATLERIIDYIMRRQREQLRREDQVPSGEGAGSGEG